MKAVEDYKYVSLHQEYKLNCRYHSDHSTYKKGQSRLNIFRKLRSFGVRSKMRYIYYKSVVESVISSEIICWGNKSRSLLFKA